MSPISRSKKPKTPSKSRATPKQSQKAASRVSKQANITPIEPPIKLNTPQFNKLRDEWYAKLADEGFKDLERVLNNGQMGEQLEGMSLRHLADKYNSETEHYYARWRCYLTFNIALTNDFGYPLTEHQMATLNLYAQGASYRNILKKLPKTHRLNLFTISKLIQSQLKKCITWNKTNHNGIDFIPDIGY